MRKQIMLNAIFTLVVVGFVVGYPDVARASGTAPWETALQTLVDMMTGTTARLLSILAVVGLGIVAMTGRLSVRAALSVVLGIAIVFGAASIVDMFSK